MIAKIKKGNIIYNSIVFGIINGRGWGTKAIVLNENQKELEIIKFWDPYRCIFIIDSDKSNWMKTHRFEGYDWIYKNLKRKFFSYKINQENILDKCIEMQKSIKVNEWVHVKNKRDIDGLKNAAIDFHDAYVEKIKKDKNKLVIEFSAWDCQIIIELLNDFDTNLYINCGNSITEDGYWDGIVDCNMFFEKGYIYWVNSRVMESSKDILKDETARYFKAKDMRWKIIV